MRRAKKPKYLDGTPIARPVDQWRSLAAVPLLAWSITSEREDVVGAPNVWTLTEDGTRIAQWSDADAPGLGVWLDKRLSQLHGAWHVARERRNLTEGQQRAGSELAVIRKNDAAIREKNIAKVAKQILEIEGPMSNTELAGRVAERMGGSADVIRKKLPRLLRG